MNRLYIRSLSTTSTGTAIAAVRAALRDLGDTEATNSDVLVLLQGELPILIWESDEEEPLRAAQAALEAAGFGILLLTQDQQPDTPGTPDEPDSAGTSEPVGGDDVWGFTDVSRVALVLMNLTNANPQAAAHAAANLSRAMGEDPDADDAVMFDAGVLIASTFSGYAQEETMEHLAKCAGVHPTQRPVAP